MPSWHHRRVRRRPRVEGTPTPRNTTRPRDSAQPGVPPTRRQPSGGRTRYSSGSGGNSGRRGRAVRRRVRRRRAWTAFATVRRNMCGLTSSSPARARTRRSWFRTLFGVSGVPFRLQNTSASGVRSVHTARRRRAASAAKLGTATVRRAVCVFGWSCRSGGAPVGQTIVPARRIVGGATVASMSRRRIARTSPIRAACRASPPRSR